MLGLGEGEKPKTHLKLLLEVLHFQEVVLPHLLHPSLGSGDLVFQQTNVLLQWPT